MIHKTKLTAAVLACLLLATPAAAQDGGSEWAFSLTPYLWLPTIDGQTKYEIPPGGGGSPMRTSGCPMRTSGFWTSTAREVE